MIPKEHLDSLRSDFVRMQSQFATVISEMEDELRRMRDNDKVPHDLVTKKDEQIETLIRFNNKIDDLLNVYRHAMINYHYELMWTNQTLWDALKSDQPAFQLLMHQVSKVRQLTREPKPG